MQGDIVSLCSKCGQFVSYINAVGPNHKILTSTFDRNNPCALSSVLPCLYSEAHVFAILFLGVRE
ncbi:hypothetical protein ANAPRD1_00956 [Anaplasma phagocytophilum]|nr:hypothetical protein ANAPRD1_00956 [Anaplasma phagocytophilum]